MVIYGELSLCNTIGGDQMHAIPIHFLHCAGTLRSFDGMEGVDQYYQWHFVNVHDIWCLYTIRSISQ